MTSEILLKSCRFEVFFKAETPRCKSLIQDLGFNISIGRKKDCFSCELSHPSYETINRFLDVIDTSKRKRKPNLSKDETSVTVSNLSPRQSNVQGNRAMSSNFLLFQLESCRFEVFFKAEIPDFMLPIHDLGFNISIERKKDCFSCELSHPSYETINRFIDVIDTSKRKRKPNLSKDETSATVSNLGPRQSNVQGNKAKYLQEVDKSRNSKSKKRVSFDFTHQEDGDKCDTQEEGEKDNSSVSNCDFVQSANVERNNDNVKNSLTIDNNTVSNLNLVQPAYKKEKHVKVKSSLTLDSNTVSWKQEYQGLPIVRIGTQGACVRPRPQTLKQNSTKNTKVNQSHLNLVQPANEKEKHVKVKSSLTLDSDTVSNLNPVQPANKKGSHVTAEDSRNIAKGSAKREKNKYQPQEFKKDCDILQDETVKTHINQMHVKQKPLPIRKIDNAKNEHLITPDNNTDFCLDPILSTKVQLNRDESRKRTFRPGENGSMPRESSATEMQKGVGHVDNTWKKGGGGCKMQQEIDEYQGLPIVRIGTQGDYACVGPRPQTLKQHSTKNTTVDQSHISKNSFDKSFTEEPKALKKRYLSSPKLEIQKSGEREEGTAADTCDSGEDDQEDRAKRCHTIIFRTVEYKLVLGYFAQSDSIKYLRNALVVNSDVVIYVESDECFQELRHFKAGLKQDKISLDKHECVRQVKEYWGKKIVVESCGDHFLLTAPRDIHTVIKNMFPNFFVSEIAPLVSNKINQNPIESIENVSSTDDDRLENVSVVASGHVKAIPKENRQSTGNDSYNEDHLPTITIKVHTANIADLSVDVIVTATNNELKHIDSVGAAIAVAAGRSMTDECEKYIAQNTKIDVSQHFVSCPGNIQVKQVYHACMPSKCNYFFKSNEYKRDLRQCTLLCLMHAEHQGHCSIAFPITIGDSFFSRISTAILAESYMKAVRHFEKLRGQFDIRRLQEINFVDIDMKIVQGVKKYFVVSEEDPLTATCPDFKDVDPLTATCPDFIDVDPLTATCPDFKDDERIMKTYLRKLKMGSPSVITEEQSVQVQGHPEANNGACPSVSDLPTLSTNYPNGGVRPKTNVADLPTPSTNYPNGGIWPTTNVAGQPTPTATISNGAKPKTNIAGQPTRTATISNGAKPKTNIADQPVWSENAGARGCCRFSVDLSTLITNYPNGIRPTMNVAGQPTRTATISNGAKPKTNIADQPVWSENAGARGCCRFSVDLPTPSTNYPNGGIRSTMNVAGQPTRTATISNGAKPKTNIADQPVWSENAGARGGYRYSDLRTPSTIYPYGGIRPKTNVADQPVWSENAGARGGYRYSDLRTPSTIYPYGGIRPKTNVADQPVWSENAGARGGYRYSDLRTPSTIYPNGGIRPKTNVADQPVWSENAGARGGYRYSDLRTPSTIYPNGGIRPKTNVADQPVWSENAGARGGYRYSDLPTPSTNYPNCGLRPKTNVAGQPTPTATISNGAKPKTNIADQPVWSENAGARGGYRYSGLHTPSTNYPNGGIRPKTNVAGQPTRTATISNGAKPKTNISDQPVWNENASARPKTTVAGPSFLVKEECVICMDNKDDILKLSCCKNDICKACVNRCEKCPFCRSSERTLIGLMAPGTMSILLKRYFQLPGSRGQGSYEITYSIMAWSPKQFTAHVPATSEGLILLLHFIIAFHRRLTFTMGLSRTKEKEDQYVWKMLHKMSSKAGDQEKEGFIPQDELHLRHLHSRMSSFRISVDNVNGEEQKLMDKCQRELLSCGYIMIGDNS